MLNLLLLAALAAPAHTAALPARAEKEAKCLTLVLIAANQAKDDPDKMKSVMAESWYFLGRLDSSAPGQDLKAILPGIADSFEKEKEAELKPLGEECDKAFVGRAADLHALGEGAEKPKP